MIHFQVLIYVAIFSIFSIIKCSNPCGDGCVECTWDFLGGAGYDCNKCDPDYFMDSVLYLGRCKKKCVESNNEADCKVCDTGDDRDKCLECHENYERSKDKKSCVPIFLVCGDKRYFNCKKCIKSNVVSGCEECNYHYIMQNGTCEYDFNLTRYSFGEYFNKNLLNIINLIILLL